MMLTSDDKGLAPMDIDRVQDKGKKGKGETKDGKSKGKGKDTAAKVKEMEAKRATKVGTKKAGAKGRSNLPGNMTNAKRQRQSMLHVWQARPCG